MVDVIILAGGKSQRMKQNKILLEFDGHPLIWYAIKTFLPYAENIIVVTGKYDKEIRSALKGMNVKIVTNSDYELGMFSSVKCGVKEVNNDFLILPGDCPFVKEETVKKIISSKGEIKIPRYNGQDGHPIYIAHKYKEEILSYPVDSNLKSFRNFHNYEIIDVEDKFVITNLNTASDLEQFKTERKG